jgi:hypothetical protein
MPFAFFRVEAQGFEGLDLTLVVAVDYAVWARFGVL